MSFIGKTLRVAGYLTCFLAIIVGLVLSGIPARMGVFRWLTRTVPALYQAQGLVAATVQLPVGYTFQQLEALDLTGQRALVTGANIGVGFGIANMLARQGADVTLVCRSEAKCDAAIEKIRSDPKFHSSNPQIEGMIADVSDLSSVKKFSEEYVARRGRDAALDMLFLNAGIGFTAPTETGAAPLSKDGISFLFATNVVGHHLMFKKVRPLLDRAAAARIVCTSSGGNYQTFEYGVATDLETLNAAPSSMESYGESKLAQILFTQELTRKSGPNSNLYANSFHPGAVKTGIWAKVAWPESWRRVIVPIIDWLQDNVMHDVESGALTGVFLGAAKDEIVRKDIRGKYFHPQVFEMIPNPLHASNLTLQTKLFEFLDELVEPFI